MLYLYLTLISLPFSLLFSLPLYLQILLPLLCLIFIPPLLQYLLRIEFAQAVDVFMTFEKNGNLCHIVSCSILENKNKNEHDAEDEIREAQESEENNKRRRTEKKRAMNNEDGKERIKDEKKESMEEERWRMAEKQEDDEDFFKRMLAESENKFWKNNNLRRMRQTFHSFLGVGFWKDSSSFFFSNHFERVKEGMTEDDLYEFLNEHATKIAFDPSKPRWKVFMTRDDQKRRVLIWKVHHSLGDGISLMSSILYLGGCDNIKPVVLNKEAITCSSVISNCIQGVCQLVKFISNIFCLKVHPSLFCRGELTGRTSCYRSKGIVLKKLRTYAKKNGVSLNDVMLALVSNALEKTYLRSFNQSMPEIRVMMAASLRGIGEHTGKIELSNKINFFSLKMEEEGHKEFGDKMRSLHTELGKLKSSLVLHFQNLTAKFLYNFLPSICAEYSLSLATKKHFIVFSSLPGPVQKIQVYKHGVSDIFFFTNGLQNMRIVLNLISYNGKVHLGVSCDLGSGIEAKEVVKAFEEGVRDEVDRAINDKDREI